MRDSREKHRMCGVGAAGFTGTAGVSGIAQIPSGLPMEGGSRFRIRPTRPGHRRSIDAALRMGHCAPAAMAALVDRDDPGGVEAVLLASAMAGGIGNSGRECGALTSAILYLGQRYGRTTAPGSGLPAIAVSRRLIDRFKEIHGGIHCDDIRKGGKNPLPCMRAMVSAPEIVQEVTDTEAPHADGRDYGCHAAGMLAICEARPFHCVHSVFAGLPGIVPDCGRLRDMTYPLVGGFALSGGTCTAAAAGVLAIGLATGKIERSYGRVMAMMVRMFLGGDTMMMVNSVNNFNAAINRGQVLVEWFERTYGTTSCAELTGLTIRESETAGRYFSGGGIDQCEEIAAAVARKTREIIGAARPAPRI